MTFWFAKRSLSPFLRGAAPPAGAVSHPSAGGNNPTAPSRLSVDCGATAAVIHHPVAPLFLSHLFFAIPL